MMSDAVGRNVCRDVCGPPGLKGQCFWTIVRVLSDELTPSAAGTSGIQVAITVATCFCDCSIRIAANGPQALPAVTFAGGLAADALA